MLHLVATFVESLEFLLAHFLYILCLHTSLTNYETQYYLINYSSKSIKLHLHEYLQSQKIRPQDFTEWV